MKNDYDLYYFVKQRFYATVDVLNRSKHRINDFSDSQRQNATHPCWTKSKKLLTLLQTLRYQKNACDLARKTHASITVQLSRL